MRERGAWDTVAQHEGWLKSKDIDLLQSDGSLPLRSWARLERDYKALYNKVKDADLNSNPELLAEVEANFDIDNMFVDYYIFESFYGNTDPGNIRFLPKTRNPATASGAIWCSIWTGGCSTPPTRARARNTRPAASPIT